jgi:hypothetical protein
MLRALLRWRCAWTLPIPRNETKIPKQKRPVTISRNGPFVFVRLAGAMIILAATYVPTQLPVQYHRLSGMGGLRFETSNLKRLHPTLDN